jgi:SagB-type dehydrogenase family enzyme
MTPSTVIGTISEVVRLRPGIYRAVDRGGSEYLLHRSASQPLGQLSEPQRAILQQLAATDCSVAGLRAAAYERAGAAAVAAVNDLVDRLRAGGWLHVTVFAGDHAMYTVAPYGFPAQPQMAPDARVLSKFAVMRRDNDDVIVESPLAWCAIQIHAPQVAGAVAAGYVVDARYEAAQGLPPALAERLQADLVRAGLLVPVGDEEQSDFSLRQWSPHELLFHRRSRGDGIADGHFGRTRWAAGKFEPLPARRPSFDGPAIELDQPDLGTIQSRDKTLTEALEQRRSIRRHDDRQPITVGQISEFLYRSVGVRRVLAHEGLEHLTGPNPSGGALDPLEFYVVVRLADGIEAGLYRYDRFAHRLEGVCGATRAVRRLIESAQAATGGAAGQQTYPPQVVLLLAARFGRVGWSYEALAYSLILKQVGVAYQTMYLVATAMGLAPCALGAGDPAAFAMATGLDPLREATVGEFILGSRAADRDDELDPT